MPALFYLTGKYFWLLGVLFAALNTFMAWRRAAPEIARNPELREGYNRLFSGYAAMQVVPWLMMGLGIWLGGVPTLWHFFNPRRGNPWVLAWWGVVIGLQLILFLWVCFQGGADFLAAHPAFRVSRGKLPIQLQVALGLLGTSLGMVFLWFADMPIEQFG